MFKSKLKKTNKTKTKHHHQQQQQELWPEAIFFKGPLLQTSQLSVHDIFLLSQRSVWADRERKQMSYRLRHCYFKNNISNLPKNNYLIWTFPCVIPALNLSIFLCPFKSRKKNGSVWFFDISTEFLALCITFPSMQTISAFIQAILCFPVGIRVSLQMIYCFPFTIAPHSGPWP